MKNIVLLRSNQINSDSRVEKYLNFYDENNINYTVIGWDRNNIGATRKNTEYFKYKVGYVVGGFYAAFNRLFWFYFVIKKLIRINKRSQFIHACDLDCAFPAVLYKIFFDKKAYILFDVFDWMSADIQSTRNFIMKKIILWMEKVCLRHCNKIIICEEERRIQIPEHEKYDISVLPNIPMIKNEKDILKKKKEYFFNNDNITLSYVGWFGHGRFLNEMLDLAEKGCFNLLIAGYGNQELENRCNQLTCKSNIKYFGRVDYKTGLNIQFNADIVYAMYCKVTNNHIYAAPNKYYEAMFLGKPLLTTHGIIIGDKVSRAVTGFTIEETKEDLEKLILNVDRKQLEEMGTRSRVLWDRKYKTYTYEFLYNDYHELIQ